MPKLTTKRLGILLAGVIAVIVSFGVRFYDRQPLAGDEPHYLVMTYSLIQDHDLDVKNDYQTQRYLSYYPALLDPHVAGGRIKTNDHWYSLHGPGLAFYLVPFVWLGGRAGATTGMILLSLLVLTLTWAWIKRVTGRVDIAVITTLILLASIFWLGLAGYIYPDLMIAAGLLGGVLILTMPRRQLWQLVLLGTILGTLPWVHFKTLLPAAVIGLLGVYQIAKGERPALVKNLVALILPAAILLIAFELKNHQWYGVWLPNQIYGSDVQPFQLSPLRSLPAMAFDASKGLFTNNPALLLLFVGLPLWCKQARRLFWPAAAVFVASLALLAGFPQWQGGYAPSGRYLMEIVPLLLPAIGFALLQWRNLAARLVIVTTVAIQILLAAWFVYWQTPLSVGGPVSSLFTSLAAKTGLQLDRLMPKFTLDTILANPGDMALVAAWILLCVLLIWLGYDLARQIKTQKKVGGPKTAHKAH